MCSTLISRSKIELLRTICRCSLFKTQHRDGYNNIALSKYFPDVWRVPGTFLLFCLLRAA